MPMPNLYNISANDTIKVALKKGYFISRQKGSHIILKDNFGNILTIPNHKKLKIGTLLQIIKIIGLEKEDFLKLL